MKIISKVLATFLLTVVGAMNPTQASWLLEGVKATGAKVFKSPLRPSSKFAEHAYRKKVSFNRPLIRSTVVKRFYATDHEGPYFDPKNDVAFKKLFVPDEHKSLLISFLNSTLRLSGPRMIKSVELLPTEQSPKTVDSKRSILDVKCTDQRNFQYIVEMQNRRLPNFIKRTQYYVANTYSSQLGSGSDYISLRPVVLLTIANHEMFPNKAHYISYHKTMDQDTQEHDLEDMSYAFIELPKFSKNEEELQTLEDHWLYMFKNATKIKSMPKKLPFDEIQEAYKTLEEYSWSSEDKAAYDKARMALMDEFDALRGATEKGIAQGIAQEKERLAIEFLKSGDMDDQKIQKFTGVTSQQLEELKDRLKKQLL